MTTLFSFLDSVDLGLLYFINIRLASPFTDWLMPLISAYGGYLFLPWLAYEASRKDRRPYVIVFAFFAFLFADFLSAALKELISRPRPCQVFPFVRQLVGCGKSFSLPSNHAANSFAVASFLYFSRRSARWALAVAGIVALSRVFVGAHYPFDTIAGALLGIAVGYGLFRLHAAIAVHNQNKPLFSGLFALCLVLAVAKVLFIKYGPVDLSGDEAHYWEWSRHPDLSYYSKGPLVAWLIRAGTFLLGQTEIGVRIPAVVLSLLSSLCMYRLAWKVTGHDRTAFIAGLFVQTVPVFSALGILMTIDSPFLFLWIGALNVFHDIAVNEESPKGLHWLVLGGIVGVGMLAKYTMVFFYPSIVCYYLLAGQGKTFWRKKGIYLAALTSMIVFSPVLWWNSTVGWVTLRHTAYHAKVHEGFRLSLGSLADFAGSQLGLVTPILLALVFVVYRLKRDRFVQAFSYGFFLPTFVFFLLKSLQGKVQGN